MISHGKKSLFGFDSILCSLLELRTPPYMPVKRPVKDLSGKESSFSVFTEKTKTYVDLLGLTNLIFKIKKRGQLPSLSKIYGPGPQTIFTPALCYPTSPHRNHESQRNFHRRWRPLRLRFNVCAQHPLHQSGEEEAQLLHERFVNLLNDFQPANYFMVKIISSLSQLAFR